MSTTPQLTAFAYRAPVFDRNGKPIRQDSRVRAQVCIGRYGQTETIEGTVYESGHFDSGHCEHGVFTLDTGKPGAPSVRFRSVRLQYKAGQAIAHSVHTDFEHGHETWAEVIG